MSQGELSTAVAYLDEVAVRRNLIKAARSNPSLATSISNRVSSQQLKEQADLSLWISNAYNSIDGGLEDASSEEFRTAFEVVSDLKNAISSIKEKVTVVSLFATKLCALSPLCEIGELVVRNAEYIDEALRLSFREDSSLENSMESIISLRAREEGMKVGKSLEALW